MKELLISLNNNRNNLASFLKIIEKQQECLITNNLSSLEESILNEEKVLNQISNQQKKTNEIIQQLLEEYQLETTSLKIDDFIFAAEKKNIKIPNDLVILQTSIKELISRIVLAMKKNKILIDHSRNFIKETLAALNNLPAADAGSFHPILDRKV